MGTFLTEYRQPSHYPTIASIITFIISSRNVLIRHVYFIFSGRPKFWTSFVGKRSTVKYLENRQRVAKSKYLPVVPNQFEFCFICSWVIVQFYILIIVRCILRSFSWGECDMEMFTMSLWLKNCCSCSWIFGNFDFFQNFSLIWKWLAS